MSIYKELSRERKDLQNRGEIPDWITTSSWQMLKEKYLDKGESFDWRIHEIVDTAASYMDKSRMSNYEYWYNKFHKLLWNGFLIPSTPVMASMGKEVGCSVSCSGGVIDDSVYGFYEGQKEVALLSKHGFGTSGYLGAIRPRGSKITGIRGSASGVLPVFKDYVQVSRDISQGSQRRGAWAGYIEIDHPDYFELVSHISKNPDDANIGWIISDEFIDRLDSGDKDAIERYQKALKLKMVHGKGYFFFVDKVNRLAPEVYKNHRIHASNLCTEIALPSNKDETFTCVLSSLNLSRWKEFEEDTIYNSLVFLHCVALDFINKGKNIEGLEKAVRFTENHMALGLGALGFATYLQDNMIPFESLEAHLWNIEVFKTIDEETRKASQWLAKVFGECKMTKGTGYANTTRISIAPNLSSALIGGGLSQGIEAVYKNAYYQGTAAGEVERINPSLLPIMKKRGVFNRETIKRIITNKGSIKTEDWLSDDEKVVFKTAFEIDQKIIIRLASSRQRFIDQAQSINLFFSSDEKEEYISEVHKEAFKDPYIKSLYYIRSESGVQTSKGECLSCHG